MPNNPEQQLSAGPARHTRPRLGIAGAMVVAGLLIAFAFWIAHSRSPKAPSQSPTSFAPESNPPADETVPVEITNEVAAVTAIGKAAVAVARSRPVETGPAAVNRPEPSAYTRDLITKLFSVDPGAIPHTPDQVAAWKENLKQLLQLGPAAVPAIREFLEKNVDLGFGTEAAQSLGYGSARYALFDALAQIGGPEATEAILGTLQTVADPREIAMLAKDLERVAPDQHRQEILEAARQALAMAGEGRLADTDVGALFEVLSKYGGANIASELEQSAGRWKYYTTIALAQLPDGAGVPALIQMVQDPAGGAVKNVPALEMLAQSAAQYPDAGAALLELLRANRIPDRLWPYLASVLAGDRVQYRDSISDTASPGSLSDVKSYHIAAGNQNFYSAPVQGLTSAEINRQIRLIDALLGATSNPSAVQTMQTARNSLARRLQ